MPITARQVIHASMRLIGVLAASETATNAEAQDALGALNAFLDSASNESLTAFCIERLDVPLVPGQRVYTWGLPDGDIAAERPLRLAGAVLRLVEMEYEYPIDVIDQAGYEGITLKTLESLYPSAVYLESTYPLARLHVWVVPQQANVLGLFPWVPLRRFETLDTVVLFPPGYERWLRYALACDIAPEYGKEPSATVVATLAQAVSAIKRVNSRVPTLGFDPAFSGRQAGQWWVISDSYHGRR